MRFNRMRLALAGMAAAALVSWASPALAAPPTTTVEHGHHVTETFVDAGPDCAGTGLYEITTTFNFVTKESVFDNGDIHATFTQTGRFVAVPVGDGATQGASGHFTVWGGFNFKAATNTGNGTFTFNVNGTWDDGSKLSTHIVDHFNVAPSGAENFFSKCHD